MNLQRLEGFYWVAKTQGYSRAARAFPYPITQPGVFQQVRRLEDELGVRLFERVGKDKVVPTPRGQLLFDAVAPFFEQLSAVEARVKGGVVGGTLKLAAAGQPLRTLLPDWLRRLQAKRPDIAVALTEIPTAELSRVRTGEADLLVDWLPEVPDDLASVEIARTSGWLVAPAHGPHAPKGKLTFQAVASTPFIAYGADRTLHALQRKALALHGLSPREAFAADTSDTILGFVAAGLGFSLVPAMGETFPKVTGVVAERVVRPQATFPVYAVWRRATAANPLVAAALEVAPGGPHRVE